MAKNQAPFKIALIGAGPASLTLANILQRNAVPFSIFESSSQIRTAGGSLDLHPESGQLALKEAGLWTEFTKHARPESDVLKLLNVDTGEVYWDENAGDGRRDSHTEQDPYAGRPEIDRQALVNILFQGLEQGTVTFNKKATKIVPTPDDSTHKYDVHFADGTLDPGFDLVIGGDGAWSKVRNLLSATTPHYSGISAIETWCNDVQANAWLLDFVGAGSCFGFGEGRTVQAQRQGDGRLMTYACLRCPEDHIQTCGIDWEDEDAARSQWMDRYFSDVSPELRRVVAECGDSLVARSLYELPVGFRWEAREGVTLVGDAAHVMTPFAGVGVNVAMTDSLVLAGEIGGEVCAEDDEGEDGAF
ncbi:FAD/NAD(P)-binding domain-containing protein [Corynespora cassiicola Philippines]|uniref:FAD/NAD(P)-binding domain-containing protein n=1 Tax=Corynespora cassiicola Philippines TaxID=1448308 RepID=A0A2T2ND91_CORCC|nr:FAD/NAD(P)-binding domain-containing protein [Corynespora cassiicola Philippines]